MYVEHVIWDDGNETHATSRATAAEIEEAIRNATRLLPNRTRREHKMIRSVTDGGKPIVVIVEIVRNGVRPITAWEDR